MPKQCIFFYISVSIFNIASNLDGLKNFLWCKQIQVISNTLDINKTMSKLLHTSISSPSSKCIKNGEKNTHKTCVRNPKNIFIICSDVVIFGTDLWKVGTHNCTIIVPFLFFCNNSYKTKHWYFTKLIQRKISSTDHWVLIRILQPVVKCSKPQTSMSCMIIHNIWCVLTQCFSLLHVCVV